MNSFPPHQYFFVIAEEGANKTKGSFLLINSATDKILGHFW